MIRDQFWDSVFPEMPYTAAAEDSRDNPMIGAAANYEVKILVTKSFIEVPVSCLVQAFHFFFVKIVVLYNSSFHSS